MSANERQAAPRLAAILFEAAARLTAGAHPNKVLAEARQAILFAGYSQVEYLELRADDDLSPLDAAERPARLLVAAWLGGVRLIDNVSVRPRRASSEESSPAKAA